LVKETPLPFKRSQFCNGFHTDFQFKPMCYNQIFQQLFYLYHCNSFSINKSRASNI